MDRELKTGLIVAAGVAAWVVAFIFLIRYAVPAILEAHFAGSLLTASAVGVLGVIALVWAGWRLLSWAARALKSKGPDA